MEKPTGNLSLFVLRSDSLVSIQCVESSATSSVDYCFSLPASSLHSVTGIARGLVCMHAITGTLISSMSGGFG